jgi:hypothetical protein
MGKHKKAIKERLVKELKNHDVELSGIITECDNTAGHIIDHTDNQPLLTEWPARVIQKSRTREPTSVLPSMVRKNRSAGITQWAESA